MREMTRATSSIGSPRDKLRVAAIEVDRDAAELVHPRLERNARARRMLLEHHRQRAVAQRLIELVALEPVLDPARAREKVLELVAGEVLELQEVPGQTFELSDSGSEYARRMPACLTFNGNKILARLPRAPAPLHAAELLRVCRGRQRAAARP